MKTCDRLSVLVACLTLFGGSAARAQDKGKVGLTMGYPASVGVLWHVSDRIALRPELSISNSSTETTLTPPVSGVSSTTTKIDGWVFGTGLSGLFYISRSDNLATYVSPRVTYSRVTSNIQPTLATVSDDVMSSYTATGSFGAQYSPGSRFGVFGEVGLGFSSSNNGSRAISKTTHHSWGTRTGVGVILYF